MDARSLRRKLLDNGYEELSITSEHAAGVASLTNVDHKDPFGRLLVSQAISEGIPLLTNDEQLSRYGACVLNANDSLSIARWLR